ncbi:MAG: SCO family protein [Candidatus Sedimenticola sp. (ex Thyasira tokunagai)]
MFKKEVFLFLLFLLLVPVSTYAGGEALAADEVPGIEEAPPGGGFTLQSADGPVSLDALRGKVVLLYFGYTKCPDVCPTSLSFMTQALNEMTDDELAKVQGVFVSVDPKRDTVESLKEYVEYFHPNLVGITGTEQEVAEVAALYGAKYYEVALEGSAFGYSVNHSAVTYLITPQGDLRFIFPHGTSPSVILEAVRYLLAGN